MAEGEDRGLTGHTSYIQLIRVCPVAKKLSTIVDLGPGINCWSRSTMYPHVWI